MIPPTDHILLNAIGTLTVDVAPEVTTAYGQGQLGLIAALMYFASIEYDSAADTAARENREMRALFAAAARSRIGLEEEFRTALLDASTGTDADLRVSTLNGTNASLKALLIRLHEYLERQTGEEARTIEERLWRLLRASSDARALNLPELA